MEAILIRHLPTEWNKMGRLQGKRDIPISYRALSSQKQRIIDNKHQLEELGPFDKVFASSLLRARQTAFVYGFDEPIIEPLLDEVDFGPFEGKTKLELIRHFSEDWFEHPETIKAGESFMELERRVFEFIRRYKDEGRILIFGHGSWMRALLSIQINGNIQMMNQIQLENNELIRISRIHAETEGGNEHQQYVSYL